MQQWLAGGQVQIRGLSSMVRAVSNYPSASSPFRVNAQVSYVSAKMGAAALGGILVLIVQAMAPMLALSSV